MRVGVVGYGYWGPNLVRNIMASPAMTLAAVCDVSVKQLEKFKSLYPDVSIFKDFTQFLAEGDLDAIVIATPVNSHFRLAKQSLLSGKHVFIEKPITNSTAEAEELIAISEKSDLKLMVDHTFIYTGAIRKIKALVDSEALGNLYYYDSTRINLGIIQPDVDVFWDLAVHDLAILNYLVEEDPITVSAQGGSFVSGRSSEIGALTLRYASGFYAHVNVSWLSPVKLRRTLLSGSEKMIVYDDLEPSEKVKIYDKGAFFEPNGEVSREDQLAKTRVAYRSGDMFAPRLEVDEALKVELEHFAHCVLTGERPLTDGCQGSRVVRILEAASMSLGSDGSPVSLEVTR